MASRREKLDKSDPFSRRRRASDVEGAPSLTDLTNSMLTPAEEDQQTATDQLDIFLILPDPGQPRRAIPNAMRNDWDNNPQSMGEQLERWCIELGIDLLPYLNNEEDIERPEIDSPSAEALWGIVDLANSIRRDGLVNPITVAREGNNFRLETGERRWLAHHLLYHYTGDDTWQQIPARIMDRLNVWRQAGENNARTNLNAISKARQFAILLMDLYRMRGRDFIDYTEALINANSDQAYYAQVADEKLYRVPRGTGDILLSAMGFQHKSALKRHRDLLSLPEDIWLMADDYNAPESVLRQMIGLPHRQQLNIFNDWLINRKVANGNLSDEQQTEKPTMQTPPRPTRLEVFQKKLLPKVGSAVKKLKGQERQQAINELERLLEELRDE